MTNDSRSPQEIERDIEEQRSQLSSNLEDLQDKFSIDTIVRQISDQFRDHGGDMGRAVSDQVKANPIPLALTGIGLAWMMFGNTSRQNASLRDRNYDDTYSAAENDYRRTREQHGRPYVAPTATYALDGKSGPSWAREDDDASVTDRLSSGVDTARDGMKSAANSASDMAGDISEKVTGTAASAKSSVSDAARSTQDALSKAGNRVSEGTETLSEEGRARVIAARHKAIELRNQASRKARNGADATADFYDQQPLVVGALALAFGAALGGALPRTKTENDLIGSQSDSLFDEAERIFQDEKAKAVAVAKSVQNEVKDIASETKADLDSGAPGEKSAVEAVGDQAKSAANRVAEAAKSSAKDKNLGKPDV